MVQAITAFSGATPGMRFNGTSKPHFSRTPAAPKFSGRADAVHFGSRRALTVAAVLALATPVVAGTVGSTSESTPAGNAVAALNSSAQAAEGIWIDTEGNEQPCSYEPNRETDPINYRAWREAGCRDGGGDPPPPAEDTFVGKGERSAACLIERDGRSDRTRNVNLKTRNVEGDTRKEARQGVRKNLRKAKRLRERAIENRTGHEVTCSWTGSPDITVKKK